MAGLNGKAVPIIGAPKNFTRPAEDATFMSRGLYDCMHFVVSNFSMLTKQLIPKWGEPIVLNRPIGGGLHVSTTYLLPPEDETEGDLVAAPANDAPPE